MVQFASYFSSYKWSSCDFYGTSQQRKKERNGGASFFLLQFRDGVTLSSGRYQVNISHTPLVPIQVNNPYLYFGAEPPPLKLCNVGCSKAPPPPPQHRPSLSRTFKGRMEIRLKNIWAQALGKHSHCKMQERGEIMRCATFVGINYLLFPSICITANACDRDKLSPGGVFRCFITSQKWRAQVSGRAPANFVDNTQFGHSPLKKRKGNWVELICKDFWNRFVPSNNPRNNCGGISAPVPFRFLKWPFTQ